MIVGHTNEVTLPFYTLRMSWGNGLQSEILEYFATEEEAEKAVMNYMKTKNIVIQKEMLTVKVQLESYIQRISK